MKRLVIWAPLAAFVIFFGVVALQLYRPDNREHPSQFVGHPFPIVQLPAAASSRPTFTATGGPRLVNVFASWCVPCIAEAPVLASMTAQGAVIDGVALRDRREDVDAFLAQNGNPYRTIGLDANSRVQLAIGSSGVPETFIVDSKGIIRHQHIGAITEGDVPDLLEKLRAAQ
ncbi:MAG TPA: redoxin family protein [Sphingomonas sp.]|jgi:cytochrome c biogenesis protein CcmG/thiol:disulfide interchange protein DsbE|nr:redoxin family protein [Sphingomonas sp.]